MEQPVIPSSSSRKSASGKNQSGDRRILSILLPTPSLGLGQELLMLLRSHHYFTGRGLNIWVDGDVARGCDAYLELLPHLPHAVQNFARHQPLFWDERVRPSCATAPTR